MSGKKGRSGRHPGHKGLKTIMNVLFDKIDQNLPAIFDALIQKAFEGDREAQIYLVDRRLGKPKQQTDVDITGGEALGAGLVVQLFQILEQKRREIIQRETPKLPGVPDDITESQNSTAVGKD